VLGPPGLPEPIRAKLSRALVDSVQDPSAQARIRSIGFEPVGSDAATFDAFLRAEMKRWTAFVKERGLTEQGR
jgi:tripartite-type tricarboxylate transporter receptor subunit TctC